MTRTPDSYHLDHWTSHGRSNLCNSKSKGFLPSASQQLIYDTFQLFQIIAFSSKMTSTLVA